jgi:hypothetical protein
MNRLNYLLTALGLVASRPATLVLTRFSVEVYHMFGVAAIPSRSYTTIQLSKIQQVDGN